ncbi:DUF4148 domain-containing protein [bacterium M00.F.Ca.ET.228.01.1.1]|uniref:DUF4148 domain-containing protein n=1 Tax=Paraburkholderia phenoliruptrix TaxID=252970 RepID=UPI001091EB8D|nr:DUF4148 domain-containing protein [Paraburkholderia phenoliruptrix]TGP47488.1 DUF4148 domain-containing protein [bacterium M00.F.Ca.ET.228.01.1.1]TGS05281.1 DUF4148 domain-containing protein [bacterium M00.F.Ca.ET.191.01.1.1]TGU10217.1 DUF4148 domain-containing protein [bacterium M00.F.Ca.ET.155.01.1.1]MBW0445732.1 DUF4148 domain-containing protein [Paraburkholderia phenoliruptrix]MBW9096497.1 DUF4148 domain-containing protein [Paraburkholderia phenoliruptrix]
MTIATKAKPILAALTLLLAGCMTGVTGGMQRGPQAHLSATQCRDLTDIRNKAPVTRERNMSELAALRMAGYHPEWRFDPYYPADLEAAQRQVNIWYETECAQAPR